MGVNTQILSNKRVWIIAIIVAVCAFIAFFILTHTESNALSQYRVKYAKPVSEWEKPNIDKSVLDEWEEFAPLPTKAPYPSDNEPNSAKFHIGRLLFNDTRLSKSGQFACESCHHRELGDGDGLPTSYGHNGQRGRRNAPNISMAAFFPTLFWDGRADSLESQALGPITDPLEMANTLENAENAIKEASEYYLLFALGFGDWDLKNEWAKFYPERFKSPISPVEAQAQMAQQQAQNTQATQTNQNTQSTTRSQTSTDNAHSKLSYLEPQKREDVRNQANAVFNARFRTIIYEKDTSNLNVQTIGVPQMPAIDKKEPKLPKALIERTKALITIENIAKSIATFERGKVGMIDSRFNRFLKGDYNALSDKELFGLDVFRNKGECMNCHYGAILSDKKFHNIGLAFYGRSMQDLGLYEVTNNPADSGKFKTPSLVNVSKSAPYGHNGIMPNLMGLIHLYDAGFPFSDIKRFPLVKDDEALAKRLESDPLVPKLDALIRPLNLTIEEMEALEAFLNAL